MPDRDWEKELAEIDRRLAAEPVDTEPAPAPPARAVTPAARPAAAPPPPPRSAPAAVPAATPVGRRHWKATVGLLARLLVTGLLMAAVVVWPYETRCGQWLVGYLATIGVTALAAIWTIIASWRHRGAIVHVLGLALLLSAAVYGAMEVLPRVGYAMPDPAHPAMWSCT